MMRKKNTASPAKQREQLQQTDVDADPNYPIPLKYDNKQVYKNYLPARVKVVNAKKTQSRQPTTSRGRTPKKVEPRRTNNKQPQKENIPLPPSTKASRQNSQPKQSQPNVIVVSQPQQDSSCDDYSEGDVYSKTNVPIYKSYNILPRERRRKKNYVPYHEQSVLDIYRMRRINFVDSDTSDSEDDAPVIYESDPYTITKPKEKQSKVETIPSRVQSKINETIKQPQQVTFNKSKIQNESEYKPQFKPTVRKRYETPPIVHPQPWKRPSKKVDGFMPEKPTYVKPDPAKNRPGEQKKEPETVMSSSDDCCCDCYDGGCC